jgi:hypothetical protein
MKESRIRHARFGNRREKVGEWFQEKTGKIQEKYLRGVLRMDGETPGYLVRGESKE